VVFNSDSQALNDYRTVSTTVQQMKDKNIDIITSLSAGDGVFIEMWFWLLDVRFNGLASNI